MTVAETVAKKVTQLPLSRQLEVLGFIELLERKQEQSGGLVDPEGLLADHPSDLSLDDFITARRAAWQQFPRETPR